MEEWEQRETHYSQAYMIHKKKRHDKKKEPDIVLEDLEGRKG